MARYRASFGTAVHTRRRARGTNWVAHFAAPSQHEAEWRELIKVDDEADLTVFSPLVDTSLLPSRSLIEVLQSSIHNSIADLLTISLNSSMADYLAIATTPSQLAGATRTSLERELFRSRPDLLADSSRHDFSIEGVRIPWFLDALADSVRKSASMLGLEDDWDGEGSPRYQRDTWARAVQFVVDIAADRMVSHGDPLPVPRIGKGPGGSIDLHWNMDSRELLVNVPATVDERISFYGDDLDGEEGTIQGSYLNLDQLSWIAGWLSR